MDAMGGDNAPHEIIKGAVEAVNEFGANIVLVGIEQTIEKELKKYTFDKEKVEVVNATEIISTDEFQQQQYAEKKTHLW